MAKKPIPIYIECVSEHDYIASAIDVDSLNASGDTEEEAIENLRDIIACSYYLLKRHPIEKLGPAMLLQLKYINSHSDVIVKVLQQKEIENG